jgi:hypothetical protein
LKSSRYARANRLAPKTPGSFPTRSENAVGPAAPIADAFLRHQNALGIHAVEDVAEASALLADQILRRHLEVVEEDFGRVVVDHRFDRADLDAVPQILAQIDEKDRQPVGSLFDLVDRSRARRILCWLAL